MSERIEHANEIDADDPRAERKRRGCRNLLFFGLAFLVILILAGIGAWFYSGTDSFADYVKRKIEANLETKMERDVQIGSITIERGGGRIVIEDVRVANAEGASHPWFAIVPRAIIEGGIESFRTRTISVDSVIVENPKLFIEIFPEGAPLTHNIPPWNRAAPRSYEITRIEVGEIAVDEAEILFQDQRNDLRIELAGVDSRITPDIPSGSVDGVVNAKRALVVARGLEPIELGFTSGFAVDDGILEIRRLRGSGDGLRIAAAGRVGPFSEGAYDLDIRLAGDLQAVEELTASPADLAGDFRFNGSLEGERGDFILTGRLEAETIEANTYSLSDLRSTLTIQPDVARLEIESAGYAEGTISGTWLLDSFAEPRPMQVDLRLADVVLESVLADWNIGDSGLRGRASGTLTYRWEGPDLLAGSGRGSLDVAPGTVAFSDAPYPVTIAGDLDFTLRAGTIVFDDSVLRTPSSTVAFSGSLTLEELVADLDVRIDSGDFRELDRLAVNFSRALGDGGDAELLGLAGSGTIRGRVSGPIAQAELTATIEGREMRYNDAPLGTGELQLTWRGRDETLRFDDAIFRRGAATIALQGTIRLSAGGPVFDLVIRPDGWDVSDALDLVDLDLALDGTGTGAVAVRGNPERGEAAFDSLRIVDEGATLVADGVVRWLPGDVVGFDLDLDVENWDVAETLATLGLDLQLTGRATGELGVEGTTQAGTVTFNDLVIREESSRLALLGTAVWEAVEGEEENLVVLDLSIGAESVPLETIIAFLDLGELPLDGDLSGSLTLQGATDDLIGAGSVIIRDGAVFGEPVQLVTADLTFTEQRVEVEHLRIEAPAGTIEGEARWNFAEESFAWVIEPSLIDLSLLESTRELAELIDGELLITSTGAGTLASPELIVEATLQNGVIQGVALPDDQAPPTMYLAIRDGELTVRAEAFGAFNVDGGGVVTDDGEIDGLIRVTITDLGVLSSIFLPDRQLPVDGSLTALLDLDGSLSDPQTIVVNGTLTELDVVVADEPVRTVRPVDFSIVEGTLILSDVEFTTTRTNFFVDGRVPVFSDEPMSLVARGTVDAAMAQLFVPGLQATGALVIRADVAGSPTNPRISGTVEIQNGSVRLQTFPQTISQIFGTILFRGNRVEIDSMTAQMGGGEIVVGGFMVHENFVPVRLRISARGQDVTIRYFEGITLSGDFDLSLSGDADRMVMRGTYLVDQALYYEDLDLAATIVDRLITRTAVTPRVSAGWQDDVALSIEVTADDTLLVDNNIADLSASADLEVVGTLANPVILGQITLNEGGEITFRDVDYQIVQGTVSFQNPFRNDPYFDITAEGIMSARGQDIGEIEEYELTVNITGTLDQITPNISSEPPLGDVTLLTLLAGEIGQTQPGLGNQTLTGAGADFLLSSVGEAIGSRILPFADTVRLESVGSSGSFSPTVTLEKQISDDLFVIVIYDTASTQNIQIIQWQAEKDWVVQFTRDSEKDDSGWILNAVDARFRRRYPGRW